MKSRTSSSPAPKLADIDAGLHAAVPGAPPSLRHARRSGRRHGGRRRGAAADANRAARRRDRHRPRDRVFDRASGLAALRAGSDRRRRRASRRRTAQLAAGEIAVLDFPMPRATATRRGGHHSSYASGRARVVALAPAGGVAIDRIVGAGAAGRSGARRRPAGNARRSSSSGLPTDAAGCGGPGRRPAGSRKCRCRRRRDGVLVARRLRGRRGRPRADSRRRARCASGWVAPDDLIARRERRHHDLRGADRRASRSRSREAPDRISRSASTARSGRLAATAHRSRRCSSRIGSRAVLVFRLIEFAAGYRVHGDDRRGAPARRHRRGSGRRCGRTRSGGRTRRRDRPRRPRGARAAGRGARPGRRRPRVEGDLIDAASTARNVPTVSIRRAAAAGRTLHADAATSPGCPVRSRPMPATVDIVAPRYALPPDQILGTFPPAGARGSIHLAPAADRAAPAHAALGALARSRSARARRRRGSRSCSSPRDEGQLLNDVPVEHASRRVSRSTAIATSRKAPAWKCRQRVVTAIFPTREDLAMLTHVREVDIRDTELAMGDDDGWMAVVLCNRLPQANTRYLACLINLEGQYDELPDPCRRARRRSTTTASHDRRSICRELAASGAGDRAPRPTAP